MDSNRYLVRKGNTFYFHKAVPKPLQLTLGKKIYSQSLGTDSKTEAIKLRDQLLSEVIAMEASFDFKSNKESIRQFVRSIRSSHKNASNKPQERISNEQYKDLLIGNEPTTLIATNPPYKKIDLRHSFNEVSSSYINNLENKRTKTTVRLAKRSVKEFITFCKGEEQFLEDIGRAKVTNFIEYLSKTRGLGTKSISNALSACTQIWDYGLNREFVCSPSPFKGHKLDRGEVDSYQPFSPFEWEKLVPILKNDANSNARLWAPHIALCSGMRIDEICGLLTTDIKQENGVWYFDLHEGVRSLKTNASIRKIPIANAILEPVLKLVKDSTNEYLFPEVAHLKHKDQNISRYFRAAKKQIGVVDSNKAFHSLRVMFITGMENGGLAPETIELMVGHRRKGMSLGLYSKGLKLPLLKEAIERGLGAMDEYLKLIDYLS
jgi:integrase